jgi:hypothetical protein
MRGFLQSAVTQTPSESMARFQKLSRSRRSKLAKGASTSLLKADQWARGDGCPKEVSTSLEQAVAKLGAKKKKG